MSVIERRLRVMAGLARRGTIWAGLMAIGALAWLSTLLCATAYAAGPLRWSAPVLVDPSVPQSDLSLGIRSVSCPSASLCVAFDDLGHVLTSTTPGSPGSWRVGSVRGLSRSAYVSCPSLSVCVALDEFGDVLVSTNPAGGAGTWRISPARAFALLTAVSCPSPALCVGVGFAGDVLSSTNPTGGASAWHAVHADTATDALGSADLSSISCPSVALCVAVDHDGNLISSTTPAGGASAWSRVHLADSPIASAVYCPSVSWCGALEDFSLFSSSDPTGGRAAWRASGVPLLVWGGAGLSCPSVSLCVAGDVFGDVAMSANPAGGERAWTLGQVDGSNTLNAMSCPSVGFCVAVDESGNVVTGAPSISDLAVPRVKVRAPAEQEQLIVRRHGRQRVVDSGLTIACPPHGPACVVTGKAGANFDTSANDLLARIRQTVPAGQQRKVVFTLTAHGVRLLNQNRGLIDGGVLTIVARAGRGAAVANTLLYTLAIPSKARPTLAERAAASPTGVAAHVRSAARRAAARHQARVSVNDRRRWF